MRPALAAAALLAASPALAATKILVTVVEQRSGAVVADLKAADFTVTDDRTARRVEGAEYAAAPVDVMLLLDTSLVGHAVQPVAADLIQRLEEKEQMAVVAYHSSADLVQDFTSSKNLLLKAVSQVKYGNLPNLLDAVYAAAGGFESAALRRVILLLTAGVEGASRVSERDVVRQARRQGVSIFPVYMMGVERSMFESLARQTGGALFSLRDMGRHGTGHPADRIFQALRGSYTVTLAGNQAISDKLRIQVNRQRVFVSALPLD
jgi:VWFA-related protein